jgi:hypothetical protein
MGKFTISRKAWFPAVAILATIGASVILSHFDWFKRNEHVALWLEGIALVLIFAWDRIDRQDAHKETMAQIEIAKQQSRFAVNSERAWLTAELNWVNEKGRIVFSETQIPPSGVATRTSLALVLEIRNDGRTPAWIENVSAGMEITGHEVQPEQPIMEYFEPLGAEKMRRINLTLGCPGKPKMLGSESLRVHITVNYRDIFESREMILEFSVAPLGEIIRRFGQRKVNFIPR